MNRVVYYGGIDPVSLNNEFSRAMFCPEVEQERSVLKRRVGSMESELHHLRKFCWLERDPSAGRLGVRLDFDTTMLGMMAGKMEEVGAFIARRMTQEIGNLYRY